MKRMVWITCLLMGVIGSAAAQRDDLYFVPQKKSSSVQAAKSSSSRSTSASAKSTSDLSTSVQSLEIDDDAYNRRGSYLETTSEEEPAGVATQLATTDAPSPARADVDEGWVYGFDGSDVDYEYAMRIVRFRNPRYAIPVSSPLYWDVVYGGALWPSWEWNIYDDGLYAYIVPTRSNWYYWDYMTSYPFGWHHHWTHHHHYYSWHYHNHLWCDPWHHAYHHHHTPGWYYGAHHGHHHAGSVTVKPSVTPGSRPNHRTPTTASTRRDEFSGATAPSSSRTSTSTTRTTGSTRRTGGSVSGSSTTGRVSTSRTGTTSPSSSTMRSSGSSRSRSTGSSRSSSTGSSRSSSSYSSGSSRSSSSYSSGSSRSSSSYSSGSSRSSSSYSSGSSRSSAGSRR